MTVRRLLWLLPGLFALVLGAYLVTRAGPPEGGWLTYTRPVPNSSATFDSSVALLSQSQVIGWVMLGLGLVACGTWGGYVAGARGRRPTKPAPRTARPPAKRPATARRR